MIHNISDLSLPSPPSGFVYEWKVIAVHANPQGAHQVELANQGWRFVPPSRHPELPEHEGRIGDQSVALMELPAELHDKARLDELFNASVVLGLAAKFRSQGVDDYLSDVSRIKAIAARISGQLEDLGWPPSSEVSEIGYLIFIAIWRSGDSRIAITFHGNRGSAIDLVVDFTVEWQWLGDKHQAAGSFDSGRHIADLIETLQKFRWVLGLKEKES